MVLQVEHKGLDDIEYMNFENLNCYEEGFIRETWVETVHCHNCNLQILYTMRMREYHVQSLLVSGTSQA